MPTDPLLVATPAWHAAHAGAVAGAVALRRVANPEKSPALDEAKARLEASLRARFAGQERAATRRTPPLPAYDAYYRRFGQTYHVLRQLETVALKGGPIPRRAALVEAVFMAELDHLLLTAVHDLATLRPPIVVDTATGDETYTLLRGAEATCKPDDMLMRDGVGVISSIVLGPDARTRVTSETTGIVAAVYAPAGIGETAMRRHLEAIAVNVRLVAPEAEVVEIAVVTAGG